MPLRIPNPHSPEEVRRAFGEMKAPFDILTQGTAGQVLVGAGVGVVPAWGTELTALTKLTVDNLTLDGAVIASDTGAISFSDENLTTTGTIGGVNVTSGADPGHTHSVYLNKDGSVALTGNMAVDALITVDGRDISVDGAALDILVADAGKVKVDAGATAGYLGAAFNDGVLRTSTGITFTDGGDFVTLTTKDSEIVHDSLSGYVGDQHVAHTGVTLTAGSGLSGGGTIAASRTFALDIDGLAADTIVAADTVAFYDATGTHNNKTTFSNFNAALDHGALLGRGDDDHSQYHTDARAATWLANNHETTYDHAHYDTAYGWGDHAGLYDAAGTAAAAIAAHLLAYNHANYDTAYGWGDHASGGYLKADGTVALTGNLAVDALITIDGRDISVDGTALDTAVGWGDHGAVGYLKADGSVPLTANWTTGAFSIIGSDHWYLRADSAKLYFGAGDDASIYHDGTDFHIDLFGRGLVTCTSSDLTHTSAALYVNNSFGAGLAGNMASTIWGITLTAQTHSTYSGDAVSLMGGNFSVHHYGSGVVTSLRGGNFAASIQAGGGNVTTAYAFYGDVTNVSGGTGTITSAYGLYLGNINVGTALNYSIYTNAGTVRLGGNVGIGSVWAASIDEKLVVYGNIRIRDNDNMIFGTGKDAKIYYDAVDLVVQPDLVGTGAVKIIGDTYFSSAGSGLPYAGIYCHDVGATLTIAASGWANKVQVTQFAVNETSNLMTPDHTNDHITVVKTGVYLVTASICASSTGGTSYEIAFGCWKNNGATEFENLHVHRTLSGGGGDIGSMTISGLVSLTAADTLELWAANITNTNNIIIESITLSAVMVGG